MQTKTMGLIVVGAAGRMGQALIRAIAATPGVHLAGAVERKGSEMLGRDAAAMAGLEPAGLVITDDAAALVKAGGEAILDFTSPTATRTFADLAAEAGIAHIVGTTGLEAEDMDSLRAAALKTAVMQSGNMSLGVNLLAGLVKRAAAALDEDFDIEIVEMHHRMKVDAPSGTALLLGEAAAAGRKLDLATHSERGRDGITGKREIGAIGFASLRGGTVIGEHTVMFAGPLERIELTHRAEDRSIFARGAVKAALWTRGKPPGFYSMADVLGLTQ
jgi:4-hydroxy-tetrahydrodipicolinate reductase